MRLAREQRPNEPWNVPTSSSWMDAKSSLEGGCQDKPKRNATIFAVRLLPVYGPTEMNSLSSSWGCCGFVRRRKRQKVMDVGKLSGLGRWTDSKSTIPAWVSETRLTARATPQRNTPGRRPRREFGSVCVCCF